MISNIPIIHHKISPLNLETSITKKRWAEGRTWKSHWPSMKAMKVRTQKKQELLGCRECIHENGTMDFRKWKMMQPAALTFKTNFLNETCQPDVWTFKKNKSICRVFFKNNMMRESKCESLPGLNIEDMGVSQNEAAGTGSLSQGSVSRVCFVVCFAGLFRGSVSHSSSTSHS